MDRYCFLSTNFHNSFNPNYTMWWDYCYNHFKGKKTRHTEVKLIAQGHLASEEWQVEFVPQRPGSRVDFLNYYINLLLKEEKGIIEEQGRQKHEFKIQQPTYIINLRLQFSFEAETICFLVSQQELLYKVQVCVLCQSSMCNSQKCTEVDDKHFNPFYKYQIFAFIQNAHCYMLIEFSITNKYI